jgi:hypothetical protein
MWIYAATFAAGLLGLFGHWLTRYKQSRTTSSFKEYMLNDWTSTVQSVMANISSSMGIAMAMPDDIGGKLLVITLFTSYTAGYMFDSTLNRDKKATVDEVPAIKTQRPIKDVIKNDKDKSINDILSDDGSL